MDDILSPAAFRGKPFRSKARSKMGSAGDSPASVGDPADRN